MGWFFYGLFIGAGGMRLVMWVQQEQIDVAWYAWALGVIALALGALAGQNFFASFKELEPRAAWMGLIFIGVPALILAGVTTLLFL
jgi:hypothetical protein